MAEGGASARGRAVVVALAVAAAVVVQGGCAIDWIANEFDADTSLQERVVLSARGNAIWRVGPGGATPSLFYSDVRHPDLVVSVDRLEIPYDPSQIEIVGWVETSRTSRGFSVRAYSQDVEAVGLAGSDYGSAFIELMEEHALDGLMNKIVDTEVWQLNFYVARFYDQETRLGGVGYRFRDRVDVPWRLLTEPPAVEPAAPPADAKGS